MRRFKLHAKVLGLLMLAALCFLLIPEGHAKAAEYEPCEVKFEYRHRYTTTDTSVDAVFHYLVTAKEEAPLPAEADGNGTFSYDGVSGEGTVDGNKTVFDLKGTLTFTFTKPGVYSYELKADLDKDNQKANVERYKFDPRVTTITFYIVNAEEGSMKLSMLTAEDDDDVKPNEVRFDPGYEGPEEETPPEPPEPPKTGDESQVALYGVIMVVSLMLLVVLLVAYLRKKGREDHA